MKRPEKIDFQQRISKSTYPSLGIPVPEIRKLAKDYTIEDFSTDLIYFDELLLSGIVIAKDKRSFIDKKKIIEQYLDKADSWALIDSFCSSFVLKKNELEEVFDILSSYLNSNEEFRQRFAIVMFLTQFLKLDENLKKLPRIRNLGLADLNTTDIKRSLYLDRILKEIDRNYSYYNSSMATAWFLAEALLVEPSRIISFMNENTLDDLTINRMVDKVRQSRIPNREVKDYFLKYKR